MLGSDKERGAVLAIVLILIVIVPIFAMALFNISATERLHVSIQEERTRSYYLAQAAAHAIKTYILEDPLESDGRVMELLEAGECNKITLSYDDKTEEIQVDVRVTGHSFGVMIESETGGGRASRFIYRLPDMIAVGNLGEIICFNGVHWIRADSGIKDHLNSVAWNGHLFAAVGKNGTIIVSDNGMDWETVDSGTNKHLQGITTDGDSFVAVGNNGTIIRSIDGVDWKDFSQGANVNAHFNDVAYGNGRFVSVMNTGDVFTRIAQGENWERQYSYSGDHHTGITYCSYKGSFYVAGTWNTTAQILYSSCGDHWTWTLHGSGHLLDVSGSPGGLIAVGKNGLLWKSEDGVNWDRHVLDDVHNNLHSISWHEPSSYSKETGTLQFDAFWVGGDDDRLSFGYTHDGDGNIRIYEMEVEQMKHINDIISLTSHQEGAWQ